MEKTATENIDLKIKLLEDFRNLEASLNGESKNYFHKIRQDAIAVFEELGFPVKKLEEWKYTNINPILKHDFKTPNIEKNSFNLNKDDIMSLLFDQGKVNLLVFVNGQFNEKLSEIITSNEKIFIGSFLKGRLIHNDIIEKHFSKYADYKNNSLVALNTAFAKDGAFVYLKKGIFSEPVHILHISDSRQESFLSQPRNLFVIEEGSEIKITENYFSIGDKHSFTNVVTEIYLDKNSDIHHYKIQNENDKAYHIGTTQVMQEKDSRFSDTTISWGGSITRNNLNSVFGGSNTECHFYGLYLLSGKQHVDNHTLADHAMPNCYSNELYKGIIDDKATGVFNGKIMVRPDAQKTNAYQSNGNILLSEDATIYSKPQLEIFADDVKCSHGATSGQLNEDEMFYLRSRGIGEKDARAILLNAFASEVLESIKIDSLLEMVKKTLEKKLSKN